MDTFVIILLMIVVGCVIWGIFIYFQEQKKLKKEQFENFDKDQYKLYVFVSSQCPHCHTYIDNHHNDVCALAKSKGIIVEKVQSDGTSKSNDLFAKYNVQFIPTGIIVKDNKVHKNLGSDISTQS